MGNFYRSDNACRRFLKYIYNDLFKAEKQNLQDVHFYSILIDGATDSSVTENELIYLRYVQNGVPSNHYFSIEDVEHADAAGILRTIEESFAKKGLRNWKDKLVGFGSDGASVNLGVRGGIAALIKRDVPHLVIIHCIAHRLELAANSAIKHHKIMKEIQDILTHIYKHYHYSPKALREIRLIGEALEEKVRKPTNITGTRWLPQNYRALSVLTKNFKVILTHFEHIREARVGTADVQGRAVYVSKRLKDYKFLYTMFFVLDVLEVLNVLSLKMQKDDLTLSSFFDALATASLSMVNLSTANGKEVTDFVGSVQENKYHDIELKNVQVDANFSTEKKTIVNLIIAAIEGRFDPMQKDSVIKAATNILSISDWPKNRNELAIFGTDDMALLLEHFHEILEKSGCNVDAIMAPQNGEFMDFKAYVSRHRDTVTFENFFVFPDLKARFKNMCLVLELMLSFPLSSAACERGFSTMKRVKTDWRSSLKPEVLEKLMFVVTEGPPLTDFSGNSVFDLWISTGGQKKPGYNPNLHRKAKAAAEAVPDPESGESTDSASDDDITMESG